MSTHLSKQIERIADETPGNRCNVIVQMQSPDNFSAYLEATTEAIEQRSTSVSARSLVPPKRDLLNTDAKGKITPASKRKLERSTVLTAGAILAGVALGGIAGGMATPALINLGLQALEPLLESDWIKTLTATTLEPSKAKTNQPPEPVHFWSSSSAVLELSKDQLQDLPNQVPNIADIYPNRIVKVPPVFKATTLPAAVEDHKAYTWGLSRTGALACWGTFGARGKEVLVAVLDTGIDPNHQDLQGKIAAFAEFDRDGALLVDDIKAAKDYDQHGTHCAGTIVGSNASGRWIGMAPEAKILAGVVLKSDEGEDGRVYGSDAQILAGMQWAISKGAHVISMSLGGLRLTADVLDTYTRTIINANRLGIPVIVSAGNEGNQITGSPGNDYFAFTVGATDVSDRAAGFSGGRTQIIEQSRYIRPEYLPIVYSKPEVTAPGVDIYSAVPGGKWETWNGTSMAAPHVAGAMALLLSKPSTIAELEGTPRVNVLQTLLISTVEELGEAGQNHRFGYGRIDVLRAFGYAKELGYYS